MASRYLRAYTLHVHIKIIISSTSCFYHKLFREILRMEIDNVRTRRLLENDKQFAASWAIILHKATNGRTYNSLIKCILCLEAVVHKNYTKTCCHLRKMSETLTKTFGSTIKIHAYQSRHTTLS